METRCMGCMQIKRSGLRCEHCGFDERTANNTHQLPVGTVVGSQYTLGRVLGQGGFGITYIGWDNVMQQRVAVKEYFPSGYAGRSGNSQTVTSYDHQSRHDFENNKRRFLREAESLAKLWNVPQIVKVLRHFEENGTAYIAMEYVEGVDLRKYVKQHRGSLSVEETLSLLGPVIQALGQVHKAELVHRDISPDNIMVLPDGSTKLLDFGAARYVQNANALQDRDTSTQAILKHGFAPPEQYRTHGALGPWTDVYAMCATIYYCLTGKVLPEAMSRTMDDEQIDWSGLQALTRRQRAALEKGLEIQPKDRFASMEALWQQLKPQEPKPAPKKSKKPLLITAAAVAAVAAAVICICFLPKDSQELPQGTEQIRVPEATAAAETSEETMLPVETGSIDIPGDLIPAAVTEDVNFTYTENTVGITITGYEGQLPERIGIPQEINGKPVIAIGDNAFQDCKELVRVVLPDCIAEIGQYAFEGCTGMVSINLPDQVASIGYAAFLGCSGLESISIPKGVTSIDALSFKDCSGLTSVTIPDGIKSIWGNAFSGCTGLTGIIIPDSVTKIAGRAFYGCTNLSTIVFPETMDTFGGLAFHNTAWLNSQKEEFVIWRDGVLLQYNGTDTNVIIPETVKVISSAFADNTSLVSVTIPDTVISIDDNAFDGCIKLSSVSIPAHVTRIGHGAFRDCGSLTSVTIPDSVKSIGENAFANCTGLTSVTIPDSVESISNNAFANCTGLTSISIPDTLTGISRGMFSGCTNLTGIDLPSNILRIDSDAFNGCTALAGITFPEGLKTIHENAFYGCTSLTQIVIPESVSSIKYGAFWGCDQLTSVKVPRDCDFRVHVFPENCMIHYY